MIQDRYRCKHTFWHRICHITLLAVLPLMGYAQESRYRIMEYNVENLFDTIRSVLTDGIEFTPEGNHQWNTKRYWRKLSDISKTIASAGGKQPVDLVTLIEVENDSVVADLVHKTRLWRIGYEYMITHSKDTRGINIALLYQPHRFRPLTKDSIRVNPENAKKGRPTRDILHVSGEIPTGDTLDIFVCHLPSRRGGKYAMQYREAIAKELRNAADSVMHTRRRPQIVITGDFNAYYPEKVFTEGLLVKTINKDGEDYQPHNLYLMTHKMKARNDITGTYKFQGEWSQLDQIIVSGTLLSRGKGNTNGLCTTPQDCKIVDFEYLLQKDKSGNGVHPYRTYLGPYYQGGYSDHLPVIIDFYF